MHGAGESFRTVVKRPSPQSSHIDVNVLRRQLVPPPVTPRHHYTNATESPLHASTPVAAQDNLLSEAVQDHRQRPLSTTYSSESAEKQPTHHSDDGLLI